MESSPEYKKFKKSIYDDFLESIQPFYLSYRIHRWKVEELNKKDPTVTIQQIKADFEKYPKVREVVIDNKEVVLCPKNGF